MSTETYAAFAAAAEQYKRQLTPPACDRMEPRWEAILKPLESNPSGPMTEIKDQATGLVIARYYRMDARTVDSQDQHHQTTREITSKLPPLPQTLYPHLLVLVKNPPNSGITRKKNKEMDLGSQNALAIIPDETGQPHIWGVTPEGLISRPWIGSDEPQMLALLQRIQPPADAILPQFPLRKG